MPSPAQVAAGRTVLPTGDYATDLAQGTVQTRVPSGGAGQPVQNIENVITPVGWNTTYLAALAKVASAPLGILFAGDSITQGYGATDFLKLGFKGLVRSGLLARAGMSLYGDFSACYDSDDFVNAYTGGGIYPWQGTPPWVITVNPGGGSRVYAMVGLTLTPQWPGVIASGTEMARFTWPLNNCTAFDVVYWNLGAGGGNFQISVDGGAPSTITHSGTPGMAVFQIRGLSAGNHTIRIAGQSGTNVATVNGITAYNTQTGQPAAGGLWFGHLAYGGATISAYGKTTTGNPVDRLGLFANAAGLGPPFGKTLIINAFIAGDAIVDGVGARNGLDHFEYNQVRFLEACRQANPFCSELFFIPQIPDSYYTDSTTAAASLTQNYKKWIQRKVQIALAEKCAVVNMYSPPGQTPVASGLQVSASDVHPLNALHQMYASAILGAI